MRSIFFTLSLIFMAMMSNAQSDFKKIQETIQKGHLVDAQKMIEQAKVKYKSNPNASLYLNVQSICVTNNRSESNQEEQIQRFEKSITPSSEPTKSLANLLLARIYLNNYNEKSYEINQRNKVDPSKKLKIDQWDKSRYIDKITSLLSTIQPSLAAYPSKDLEQFVEVPGTARFRKDCYTLFQSEKIEILKSLAEQDNVDFILPANVNTEIFNASAKAIPITENNCKPLVYNEYIALNAHLAKIQDNEGAAENIYHFINWLNSQSSRIKIEELRRDLIKSYPNTYYAKKATIDNYVSSYNKIVNGDQSLETKNKEVKKLLDKFSELSKDSDEMIAHEAEQYLGNYGAKSIIARLEDINLPNENILAFLELRNVRNIKIKVYQNTDLDAKKAIKQSPIKSSTHSIQENFYLPITTEVILDGLPVGKYYIQFQDAEDEDVYSVISTHITKIAAIKNKFNNQYTYYIVDRKTGKPITSGVKYEISVPEYVNNTVKYKVIESGNISDGTLNLKRKENNVTITLIEGEDRYDITEYIYRQDFYESSLKDQEDCIIITDRSIYRPGQTVYYKVISFVNNTQNPRVLDKKKIQIEFRDANNQNLASNDHTTNEFGSAHGSFTLPTNTQTGSFSLNVNINGKAKYITVEEYKRPKFEIIPQESNKLLSLNQNIEVKGLVKSYSGINIDKAKVTYRIVRTSRSRYDWCWIPWKMRETEISQGKTKTNEAGEYTINFFAEPDPEFSSKYYPVFEYRIYVDVTDMNGETHQAEHLIPLSYQDIAIDIETKSDELELNKFKIFTRNYAQKAVSKNVTILIHELNDPHRELKERYWESPIYASYTQEEFKKRLPSYAYQKYRNEYDIPKGKQILKENIITKEDGSISLQARLNPDQAYLLEAIAIAGNGDTVINKIIINKNTTLNNKLSIQTKNKKLGQTLEYSYNAPFKNVYLFESILYKRDNLFKQSLMENKRVNKLPITVDAMPQIRIVAGYWRDNRFYHAEETVVLEDDEPKLDLAIKTFRDKISPRSKEEWQLKLSKKGELVATIFDQSLESFVPYEIEFPYIQKYPNNMAWLEFNSPSTYVNYPVVNMNKHKNLKQKTREDYVKLNDVFGCNLMRRYFVDGLHIKRSMFGSAEFLEFDNKQLDEYAPAGISAAAAVPPQVVNTLGFTENGGVADMAANNLNKSGTRPIPATSIRTNLKELASWTPQLATDAEGNTILKFQMPEALTRWKLVALGHTTKAQFASASKEFLTQKELMITTNNPRFLRNNDKLSYSVKVTNLSDISLNGTLKVQVLDETEQVITKLMDKIQDQNFSLKAGESKSYDFVINIPDQYSEPLFIRALAESGSFSDGEQNIVPVLPVNQVITEAYPISLEPKQIISAPLPRNNDGKLIAYTVETTSNPAFYAVMSLPYLANYEHECAEQTFHRIYAYKIVQKIFQDHPELASQLGNYIKADGTDKLMNNPELKNILLHQTPWLIEAKSQNAELKELYEMSQKLDTELPKLISQLQNMQVDNAFPWFKGMQPDMYITNLINTGIGRLYRMGIITEGDPLYLMAVQNLKSLDADFLKNYKAEMKNKKSEFGLPVNYLYMRSFFASEKQNAPIKNALKYYLQKIKFVPNNIGTSAQMAIICNRFNQKAKAKSIAKGIFQSSIHDDQLSQVKKDHAKYNPPLRTNFRDKDKVEVHWKNNRSPYWYDAPITNHVLAMEALSELNYDESILRSCTMWLLENKRTNHWNNTIATADACYILLKNGFDYNAINAPIIKLNDRKLNTEINHPLGYNKIVIPADQLKSPTAQLSIENTNENIPLWAGVYNQYTIPQDKISESETKLKVNRTLYIVNKGKSGEELVEITKNTFIPKGTRLRVRMTIDIDRPMSYLHLQDMRSAAMEPTEALTRYEYKSGLGYQISHRDVATHLFIHHANSGIYTMDYDVFITQAGNFSSGVSTLQCMYAPEFAGNSEGGRIITE